MTMATPKQIEYARQFGIPSPEKLTRQQCREAIDKAKEQVKPRAQALRSYPIENLIDLASMKRESAVEFSAPCPVCGGTDRLHVNTQKNRFFCSHCHGRGKWQNPVWWLVFTRGITFLQALDTLDGGIVAPVRLEASTETKEKEPPFWQDPTKHAEAQGEANAAASALDGSQGADYLARRGIPLEVAKRWRVGFAVYQSQPCITFPYWGMVKGAAVLKALQFRSISAIWRYKHKEGSERGLFGAWLCNPAVNKTLILCEGELNAISISAAAGAGCDVVSFGSQAPGNAILQSIKALAARYALVIIWADEPENVQKVWEAAAVGCLAIHGINSFNKQDANDLLVLGRLGEYMAVVREAAYKKACKRITERYESERDTTQKARLYEADDRLMDAEIQCLGGATTEQMRAA